MCRHLAYLGPPVPVADPIIRGPHSLRTQSWAPREMRGGGTINADGFGVAWWTPVLPTPPNRGPGVAWHGGSAIGSESPGIVVGESDSEVRGRSSGSAATVRTGEPPSAARGVGSLGVTRYRNAAPIWSDPAVDEVLPQLFSGAVVAAVRSATAGLPVERAACAPFTRGRWAFSHNGAIPDWRRALTAVATEFGVSGLLEAEALTDSAVLWVILHALLERSDPETALRQVVRAVLREAPGARLNLLLCDGETVWATTRYHSLAVLADGDSVVVASEPYDDDPRWQPIADGQLVVARAGRSTSAALDIEIERAPS
ncbi:class II glutamine amidotransferase [Nocardia sp. NPDC005978]|uniref:class II glutamine amidotransferase n=1 Tax=Nocardia sp. NPDC005978 TaxID=3156725 RepID=UPI0033A407A6